MWFRYSGFEPDNNLNRSMIALTRGVKANHPCPTCLVARKDILNLSKHSTLRTSQNMRAILEEARSMNATDRENRLKGVGLQDVQVCSNWPLSILYYYYLYTFTQTMY
jgi:hypothetical protein